MTQYKEEKENKPDYNPSDAEKERIKFVYDERSDMVNKRNNPYVQFNDRNLKEFIDDSEKRLNSYVPDRASQGKEEWQSNIATRVYANKAKALMASVARNLPEIKLSAVDENEDFDNYGADISEKLVTHSYMQGNSYEDMFFLGWSNIGKGTVLEYEGFEKQNFTKKRIESFDMMTGDIEEKEEENISYGEPVNYEIPLMNLLIKNFFIRDIQDQPAIILETYYADRERFQAVYGNYKNFDKVKDCSEIKKEENDKYFKKVYQEDIESGKGYLVSRYMNKYRDIYRIVANGVELFNGPLPFIDVTRKYHGKKAYPIAKTIFEPFANSDFFYGNSMPNSAMAEGDALNSLYNSSLDKQYRALVPPLLVGMVNKDMLDVEDEIVAGDTKIYVDDVNQVQQMDLRGITDSDVKMLDMVSQGINMTTLDPQQQGVAEKYVTARAAIAADERAKKLQGIFFMFLESLWLQKIRLRIPNVLMSYTLPKIKRVADSDGKLTKFLKEARKFNIEDVELSDDEKGTLSIEFRDRDEMGDKNEIRGEIEAEEERNLEEGRRLEKVILPFNIFEGLAYNIEIIPESLWKNSQAINLAMVVEKISMVAKMFPEYFSANKETMFRDLLKNYDDDISRYEIPESMSFEQEKAMELLGGRSGSGIGSSAGGGLVGDITGSDTNNAPSRRA